MNNRRRRRRRVASAIPLPLLLGVSVAAVVLALMAGCGYSGATSAVPAVALSGSVQGGRQPVRGSSVQLYAAGTSGNGSSAKALLGEAVKTDDKGNFSIPAAYGCPSPTSQVFVIAHGGNPAPNAEANSALNLIAALGSCASLSRVGPISINEVTTIGSVWPLSPFMKSATEIGSASGDANFLAAVSSIPEFINIAGGSSPGTPTTTSSFTESSKLYSLANLLASCVNSNGGASGDSSPCGQLFAIATSKNDSAPSDTITAAMQIAQHPDNNVTSIFSLTSADSTFQPALTSAPSDWTLLLTYPVATPAISLPTGTYTGSQEATITDATPNSTIYYTTDGTVPTTASSVYSGPLTISISTTLQAIAYLQGSQSSVAMSTLTIASPLASQRLVFLEQPTDATTGAPLTPAVEVAIEDNSGNVVTNAANPVTLALTQGSGLKGTLTVIPQNGVATFSDLSLTSAGNYALTANSPNLVPATSANFIISVPSTGNVPSATKLVFLQEPSNALTLTAISPAVQVILEDSNGNPVSSAATPVTLVLQSATGLGGTLWTALPQNGIATFSNLMVGVPGTYTLLASGANLASAVSSQFSIASPAGGGGSVAAKLAFLQQPSNALVAATISPAVSVVVEDSNGNAVTGANDPITIALSGGTGLGGTLTVTPQNGIAVFGNLSVSNAGIGYALAASGPGLSSALSNTFTVSAPSGGLPVPVKLAFKQEPSNALVGATISPAVSVTVEDSNGNPVLSAINPITLTLSGGTGLKGTPTAIPLNGVATFSNLSIDTAGSGYTLSATSLLLASATSTRFTITAVGSTGPTPLKLAFLRQPSDTVTGATMLPVQVVVQDSNGDTVSGATNSITLALSSGSGLGGTLTVAAQNGIATFSNLDVSTAGSYMLSATSSGLASATSASFTISAPLTTPTPTRLAFIQQPSNALTGATIAPAVTVAVQDVNGNTVTTATNPITLALGGGINLGGTATVTPLNGVATFNNLSINTVGSYMLSATSSGLASATSASFTITAPLTTPTPTKLAFIQQPSNALTGATIAPAVTVAVQDVNGNTVTTATNPITLALGGGINLGGTATVTPLNGVATFNNLSINTAGSYMLSATSSGLASATSASFTITAPLTTPTPTKLAFIQQPSNALTGATIAPAVTVAVQDVNGNTVTTATNPITLALGGGINLGGTATVTPLNGVATFNNLSINTAGSYMLSATSSGLASATSASFTITAPLTTPTPTKLAFIQQPSNALTGATIAPAVTVAVQDVNGNTVTTATNPITLALGGGINLGGTATVTPLNGVATFNNLSINTAGSYMLSATSSGLASATSASFTITAPLTTPTPTKLAFIQQPSNALTGATIAPAVTVAVQDVNGNTVTTATNPITLALGGGINLGGTATVTPLNGVATFNNLSINTAGSYMLSATSSGLASATSASFTITAPLTTPTPTKLAFIQQPSNALTGATIAPAVTVAVQDVNGNTVTTATNPITLALGGGINLGGTATVTPLNGVATFNNLSINTAGSYMLSATSSGLASATSASFTITAPLTTPTPTKLAFIQQPSNALTGATIAPAVTVAVQDVNGNTVTTATNPITLALGGGINLGGTATVTPLNGVATFNNLSINTAGSYMLSATSSGLASATSASFTITAPLTTPTPTKLAFIQQPSNALTGATISPAITVAVEDSNGATVTSATNAVTVALASGSGLAGTVTATPQNGVATFSNLSVSTAGTYSLSATSSGLSSATSSSFTISLPATSGTTYYISPTGSDSNSGLSVSSPWLTPNHSVKCGDIISAASGTYTAGNFNTGKWGTVSCSAGNNVAWLQCATFDTCKISTTTSDAMWVDESYWGVQGWEVTTSNYVYGACFHAGPRSSAPTTIHHIIFANDIANGCMGGGFTAYNSSTSASVDYIVYIGNIAYNSAHGTGACYSGFNVYQPIASDTNAGTHMFVAGNFSWANVDGDPCAGTAPTDGEGINFDTWDFSQGGGSPYSQQGLIENNIEFLNGGDGIEVENNSAGGTNATIYIKNNTQYGDRRDNNETYCTGNGEIDLYKASNVTATNNLIYTGFATGCGGDPIYAIAISTSDATNVINDNFASGMNGNNTFLYSVGSLTLGLANILGTNPGFANPVNPLAPSCGGSANVNACMASVAANFTPTVSAAKPYGYQSPSPTNVYDPLFPQWVCNVNLPSGLVTMGCQTQP